MEPTERPRGEDRTYEAPEVRELGTVAELTLDAPASSLDEG